MNKYIRLKDKIVETVAEDSECYYFNKLKKFVYKDEGYKTSDFIEKLCDKYVVEDDSGEPFFCEDIEELKFWFNYNRKRQFKTNNCYCAIWVKGEHDEPILKPVAKINDEGMLVLI